MLRRLGIRGKVLAALSVPVLVLTLLAGIVSMQSVQDARTARTVTTLLGVLQDSRGVVEALQAERQAAVPYSNGDASLDVRAELEATRQDTDAAIEQLGRSIEEVNFETVDSGVQDAARDVSSILATVDDVRGRVDARNVPSGSIVNNYKRLLEDAVAFPRNVADRLDDRRLAAIISAHASLTSLVDDYSEEEVLGSALLSEDPGASALNLANLFPASKIAHAAAGEAVRALGLGDAVVPPLGASWNGAQAYDGYRTLIASGQETNFAFIKADDWSTAAELEMAAFDEVQEDLRRAATARASAVSSAALRTAILTIAAAVLAVILSITTALTIARSIVNPLRRLTVAAGVVRDELPKLVEQVAVPGQTPDMTLAHIPVDSRDEIGQLATAFNEVNQTTMQVAQEQAALRGSIAEMFVNVARRDQVLLNRQLSFIDALERSEEDPTTLADLFRLDHLATRMRRNAESLLVLAGIDTGRRLRETLPLSDVIRTASSEIEHYERVQLDLPADPLMLGHTALPAAHMMAELLENATVFSEPGTPVQVSTGVEHDAVVITILDQGLGMTPEELAEANEKIRTTSASDVLGSQRLGMFVVGRISSRLGSSVVLSLGPDGRGTLASIRMPLALFVEPDSIPLTPTHRPAVVETFVLPEEAAEVVHDTAFAPLPTGVQDVAPGALGSEQNPAEAVDLQALTDGTTGLGLPKRRARNDVDEPAVSPLLGHREEDDAAAAPSIPLAPSADALADAAASPLASDEAWAPPVIAVSKPLVSRRGPEPVALPTATPSLEPMADAPALPTRQASGSALPTRQASGSALPTREASTATGGLPLRQPAAAQSAAAPRAEQSGTRANPDTRSAMFSGFRSRRAELAAAAIHVDSGESTEAKAEPIEAVGADGADRLAAAAAGGAAAFFGRGRSADDAAAHVEPVEAPMVIPALVADDDDDFVSTQQVAPAAEEWHAPRHVAEHAPEQPWAPVQAAPVQDPAPWGSAVAQAAAEAEPWSPIHAQQPWATVEQAQPEAEVWAPVQPEPEVWAPAQPEAEVWAPAQPEAEVWAPLQPEPVAQVQPWAPAQPEPVAQVQPWETAQSEPWAPAQPEPVAQVPHPQEPVAPDFAPWQPVAATAAASAPWSSTAAPTQQPAGPAFSELVQGPSRRDVRPPKRRFGLFGRKAKETVAAAPLPVLPAPTTPFSPPPAMVPPAPQPVAEAPSVAPVRQSAWSSTDLGAHAFQESAEPTAPAAPPAPVQLPTFAPEPQVFAGQGYSAPEAFQPPSAPKAWEAAPAPAPVAPSWAPSPAPSASAPVWAPAPAPSGPPAWSAQDVPARAAAPVPTPEPVVPTPHQPVTRQTTFTPEPSSGAFDDEVTNMLAQRADIAQQALAELSQLSSYRPKAASAGAGAPSTLARRTPGSIPAAPEIKILPPGQRTERDANQVRSLLSSFQSGTSRGRQAADPDHQTTGEGNALVGDEGGSDVGGTSPVTAPDTDLTQRSTSW